MTGLFVGIWMWYLLPPAPRQAWPVRGSAMVLSGDGRRVVMTEVTWLKPQRQPGVLSGGGPPSAERSDLHVYDVSTGRRLATFGLEGMEVRSPAISEDGRRLAAVTMWRSEIREWDIDTHEEVGRFGPADLPGKESWALHASYSPAGELLVTVRTDKEQRVLWHCRERRLVAELNRKEEFAPNEAIEHGFLIADAGQERWKVWRLDTGELTGEFPQAPDGFSSPSHIALSKDGKRMAHGSREQLRLIHADGTTRELKMNASMTPVLSPDSNLLAVFAWQNTRLLKPTVLEWLRLARPRDRSVTLKLHELADGREIAAFDRGVAACFSPDSRSLLVLTDDQMLQVWDIPPRAAWLRIVGLGGLAGAVVFLGGWWRRRRQHGGMAVRNISSKPA